LAGCILAGWLRTAGFFCAGQTPGAFFYEGPARGNPSALCPKGFQAAGQISAKSRHPAAGLLAGMVFPAKIHLFQA
jgi:hypothetical protein